MKARGKITQVVCMALLVVMFCAWPGRAEATEYVVVEDFESYLNNSELYDVWNDYWVNGSNAEIFLETDPNIVQDSNKAVMLWYDNSFKIGSEYPGSWMDANPVDLEVGTDWTVSGVNTLVVHFRGSAGNSATVNDKMWLELADTSSNVGVALYDGDANDVTEEWWHEWDISLWLFDACGVNLTAVEWVAIGFGGYERTGQVAAGGDGVVHFDDIRLGYPVAEVSGDINVVNPSFEWADEMNLVTCHSEMDDVLGWTGGAEPGEPYPTWSGADVNCGWELACDVCHDFLVFPDGNVVAFMAAGNNAYQLTDATITVGRKYTLTFDGMTWWEEGGHTQPIRATFYYPEDPCVPDANQISVSETVHVVTGYEYDCGGGPGECLDDWEYGLEAVYIVGDGDPAAGERLGIKIGSPSPATHPNSSWAFADNVRLRWEWATEAYDPSPEDGAELVSKNAALSWTPGVWAAQHEVYLGTDEAAVANADSTDTTGIYIGAQEPNSYTPSAPLVLGETYYWKITEVNSGYSGPVPPPWEGDVWSFRVEGHAYDPSPEDGAVDVPFLGLELEWTAGAEAETHDVYFGTDETAVANATTSSPEYETPLSVGTENYSIEARVTVGCTYYWRIDERSAGGSHIVTGDVWSFTASEFVVVEDFESYQNQSELWSVWNDYWVNGSGAEIFIQMEPNFVREGNSVELRYYNDWKPGLEYPGSWMDANPLDLEVGPDWTAGVANTLVVHFLGRAGNSATVNERMWLELADTSSNVGLVLYDGDADDVTEEWWHKWEIGLGLFDACGVDLTEVEWVAIGFGGYERTGQVEAGGTGIVHFDDIRLEYTVTEVNEPVVVEDFDSYENNSHLLSVWNDYWVNGSGAEIFLEKDPNFVHDGNSLMFMYNNWWTMGGKYIGSWMDANPVDLEVGPDWTVGGADRLVVYFRGSAGNSATINERMWLELADTSSNVGLVLYDGDADDVTEEWWHKWDIGLGLFDACGVDLTEVEWLAIGFGGYERTGQVEEGGEGRVYFDDIRLEPAGAGIEVSIDIKPGFCPNYLSVNSRGTLPVAVLGTEEFDVDEIDVASVRLNGVAAVRHSYEDVATPVADANDCDCTKDGADGYLDLELAFKIQDLVDTFPDVNDGDVLSLALEGALTDGTAIEGGDCIVIRDKK